MFRLALITFLALAAAPGAGRAQAASPAECVILLHGLARTDASLRVMERSLIAAGYATANQGYASTEDPIATLAETALADARARCADDPTPAVVTHSMGAILLRVYAAAHPDLAWGRVVMLGPPNHGSEIIDTFGGLALFEVLNGPAGLQLGTDGVPVSLPPVPFETGVIAGTQSLNPVFSAVIEGRDDGKVSVDSTRVAGMSAHLILPVTHTFMMQNPRVIVQVLSFLDTGAFVDGLGAAEALADLVAIWAGP